MTSAAVTTINNMLNGLEEDDYKAAIRFIEYLSDTRKKKKAQESKALLAEIQDIFAGESSWGRVCFPDCVMVCVKDFFLPFKPHVHITRCDCFKVHRQPKRYRHTDCNRNGKRDFQSRKRGRIGMSGLKLNRI